MIELMALPLKIDFLLSHFLLICSLILVIIACFRLIHSNNLLESIIIMSVFSLCIGISYLLMDAPDVAMTETALGACLSTCVLLNVVYITGEKYVKPKFTKLFFAGILSIIFILIFGWVSLDFAEFGDANSPMQSHISKYYVENTKHDIAIDSIVAAILASYRGYDTLGETTVILIAGLAVLLILSRKKIDNMPISDMRVTNHDRANSKQLAIKPVTLKDFIIIRIIISFIIPYIILYAVYIQLNGEISPGGGFQAGVIFATALIAYDLLFHQKKETQYLSNKTLIICGALGVLIYAITGLIPLIFNYNYLDYNMLGSSAIAGQQLGIFMIEIGVGLTVSSIMYIIYKLLQEQ